MRLRQCDNSGPASSARGSLQVAVMIPVPLGDDVSQTQYACLRLDSTDFCRGLWAKPVINCENDQPLWRNRRCGQMHHRDRISATRDSQPNHPIAGYRMRGKRLVKAGRNVSNY